MKPQTNKASNVVSINAKGDAAMADTKHAQERALILDGIDQADGLLADALLEGLRMTVRFGLTSKDEVAAHYTRCNNPDVYASYFNLGHKAQLVVGQKLALDAIDRAAATGKGTAFQRAREALQGIRAAAKAATGKSEGELKGKAATTAVKEAVQGAVAKAAERVTAKKSATPTRGTKAPDEATLRTAALECGKGHKEMAAMVALASQQARKLPAPVGRETAHKEALELLAEAAEAWAVFAK